MAVCPRSRYAIVEGEHALWNGVSEPYKHTIRAFLVHFHTTILSSPLRSQERFTFRNGSVGAHLPRRLQSCSQIPGSETEGVLRVGNRLVAVHSSRHARDSTNHNIMRGGVQATFSLRARARSSRRSTRPSSSSPASRACPSGRPSSQPSRRRSASRWAQSSPTGRASAARTPSRTPTRPPLSMPVPAVASWTRTARRPRCRPRFVACST